MFVVHRVLNRHPQYRSTDTRNTYLGRIFQKLSCVLWSSAILGLNPCIQSLTPLCARSVTTRPEYIDPRPKTRTSVPSITIYYFTPLKIIIYYV